MNKNFGNTTFYTQKYFPLFVLCSEIIRSSSHEQVCLMRQPYMFVMWQTYKDNFQSSTHNCQQLYSYGDATLSSTKKTFSEKIFAEQAPQGSMNGISNIASTTPHYP